jgi:hypothetical protein
MTAARRDRMRARLREIKEELRRRRHGPVAEVGAWLAQVVAGYFAYYATTQWSGTGALADGWENRTPL